jgi:TolB protein
MNLDGSGHSLIKNFTADARQAIWNVDKTKIVYSSNSSTTSKYEIFIMDSNGKNDKQITADSPKWWNEYPFFVGNDKIWFGFGVSNGITEFVEINYDGTGRTVKSNFQGQGRQTRIGRAYGNLIYYYKQGHSNSFSGELWKSTLDFSKEIQLTSNSIMDFLNDVSPDGKKIIFFRDGNMSKSNIWIINNDGSGEAQLTITGGSIMSLFTPDGTKILYTYHDGSQTDIYIMNLDGSGKTNITNTPNYDEVLMDCK